MPGTDLRASELLGDGWIDIPTDVFSLGERLQHGDPTIGWRGDPSMSLCWNPVSREFEVLALDAYGRPYVAWHGRTAGPSMLADLVASDWRKGRNLLAEFHATQAKVEADRESAQRDARMDNTERLAHAFDRALDLGGRRVYGGFNRKD